jgi:hypothetical protein
MLRAGVFKNEKTAEEQVVSVLNFDIHLIKDFKGRRYIERITECIPIHDVNDYTFDHNKEKTLEGKFDKFFDNATRFFSKTTNRELYTYRNVLEFVDDSYVLVNPISEHNITEMRNNMSDKDVVEFDAFLERNWGIKPPKMPELEEGSNEIEKKPEPVFKTLKQEMAEKGIAPANGGNVNMGQTPVANAPQNPVPNQQPNAIPNQQQNPNNPVQNMGNPGVTQMPNNPAINNQQTPVQPNVQNNMGGVNPNSATPNINQLGSQNPSNNVNNNNNPMQQGNAGNNNPAK